MLLHWYKLQRRQRTDIEFKISLMFCELEKPPERKTTNVKPLCEIICHINTQFVQLPEFIGKNGLSYSRVVFDVQMTSTGYDLDFVVLMNNVELGKNNVAVQYIELE